MIIAYVPLLIAIIGLLLWSLSSNSVVKEAGRILFFCGIFFTVYHYAGKTTKL